jgi:hypothetical protein
MNQQRPRGRPFPAGRSGNPRGRPKGSRNKRTIADKEIIASGVSPLDFLCSIFRDARQPMRRRIEAAKCAAPYFHPRLAATACHLAVPHGTVEGPNISQTLNLDLLRDLSDYDLAVLERFIEKLLPGSGGSLLTEAGELRRRDSIQTCAVRREP